jgi:sugar phosphate isomerase/epimerase
MRPNLYNRRSILRRLALFAPAASLPASALASENLSGIGKAPAQGRLKVSLNAYSFNKPLMDGTIKLDDLLEFCAKENIDGVDLTGYYFPGYPNVPSDDFLYNLKRKAFKLGVDISGTGVRNDFTNPDEAKRKEDIAIIKNWIVCASKIGAPVIRIFSGTKNPKEYDWKTISDWMVKDIKECVEFGKAHGVVVAIQNHNDFLKTADQTIDIIKRVDSPWFGQILDIGSFRSGDPYPEIVKCIPYAVNWQIKELVYVDNKEEKVNLKKLFDLIKASEYRGYLPIETLGPGDPFAKIPVFLAEVKQALG